ncbi:MAG: FlgD immunoglobulin-like domain containing protein [bacterium]
MPAPKALLAGLPAILLAASPVAAFTARPETAPLDLPLRYDAYHSAIAARPAADLAADKAAGLGSGWRAQIDPASGRVRMAYGGTVPLAPGIRDDAQAETLARSFLFGRGDLLGVRADNSRTQSVRRAPGKWAVWLQQYIAGIPVWNGTAFVLLGANGHVGAFGSEFQPEPHDLVKPALDSAAALAKAAASLGTSPRADRAQDADLWWMPLPGGAGETPVLTAVWHVVFESQEPFGKWETFVHGTTGEILGRRNLYFPVNVIGTSTASVAANLPSYGWCDGFSPYPLQHEAVQVVGGGNGVTDQNGAFTIPNVGGQPVTVTTQFLGPYCNINRAAGLGNDAFQTLDATPGTPLAISWNLSNSRDDERTTFYHANRVHDFMKALDPTFTQLDYVMSDVVGRTDGFCPGNAWWDGASINLCESGLEGIVQYYNTGTMGDVIYHEFGHGVTQEVYLRHGAPQPPSGLHEGNSDVLANFLDRNPFIGLGFSSATGCGSGIRNAVNSLTYPTYNENGGHAAGQVIEGFHWLAWQSLLAAYPQAVADSIAFATWHYGRDLGTPQTFPDQVLWTFLADDDDADLGNGTPNCFYFCDAAAQKGFECPPCGILFTHTPPPHTTNGSAGFDLTVTITSASAALDLAASHLLYRVNGGSFDALPLTPTGTPNVYTSHIPGQPVSTEIEYYFSATDLLGHTRTSPAAAPAELYDVDVAWLVDDLEHGVSGWTLDAPTDDASSGWWDLWDPVGTAAQPEDDATPGAGHLCFITGQCAPGEGDCISSCTLSCNDVDGGTTTLFSPVYDLRGAARAKIKYARWYSNDMGPDPADDHWVVDVSNDGGTTWRNAEDTTASDARWTTHAANINTIFGALPGRVRLRFRASDVGTGSIVEAGVDDIRVLANFGAVGAPVAEASVAPASLALALSQPNPFRAQTRIEWAVPRPSTVRLSVYDVAGRAVRVLASGPYAAGRYHADWDGRDDAGLRAAAGVYFFRLTADGDARTRKVTLMK